MFCSVLLKLLCITVSPAVSGILYNCLLVFIISCTCYFDIFSVLDFNVGPKCPMQNEEDVWILKIRQDFQSFDEQLFVCFLISLFSTKYFSVCSMFNICISFLPFLVNYFILEVHILSFWNSSYLSKWGRKLDFPLDVGEMYFSKLTLLFPSC